MASKGLKAIISIAGAIDPSLGKAISDATKQTGLLGTSLRAVGGAMAIGSAAIGAASTAVVAFGKSALEAGSTFDSSMSQVAATMGTTVDQITELRDFAQEMGRTTAFSASEAADAMNILAMAGYDATSTMETLPAVLNMASAGGLGIAEAADYATGIIAGFSNETLDAATIADKLATVASSAKGDVASFGEGLSTVAGMANTTGQSMQDMTVALGILGNNNYSASEAGNALSRTLKNLYQPSTTAAKAMDALGLSAYDAEGKSRPLQDVLQDLNSRLDGMSEQAKNETLSSIFDSATLKSVPALLNNAGDAWDELDKTIANSKGAAEKMAAVQLDNLEGDVTLFKSALEGAQIAVSDQLMPTFRQFVQFGSDGISQLTAAFQEGGLSGAMDAFGEILANGVVMITNMLPDIVSMGTSLLEALIDGIVMNSDVIITALIQVAVVAFQAIGQAIPKLISGLGMGIRNALNSTLGLAFGSAANSITVVFMHLWDDMANIASAAMESLVPPIMDAISSIVTLIPTILDALMPIVDTVLGFLPTIIDAAGQILSALTPIIDFLVGELATAIQTIMPVIQEIFTVVAELLTELISVLLPPLMSLISALMPILQAIFTVLQPIISIVMQIVTAVLPPIVDAINAIMAVLEPAIDYVATSVTAVLQNLLPIFESVINPIFEYLRNLIDFVVNVFTGNWRAAWENVKNIFGNVFQALAGLIKAPMNAVIAIINGAIAGINSIAIEIPDWVPGLGGKTFGFSIAEIPYLAKGGFTNGVSIAGEAGQEAVISFDPSVRQKNLSYWAKAGKLLGANPTAVDTIAANAGKANGGGNNITFSPNVTIQGNADYDTVMQALRDNEEEFMDMVQEFLARQQAVAYG